MNGIKNKKMKKGCINLLKRFLMVGTRYFASAPNDWHSIWYHYYGRTWSITSLLGWFFAEGERFLSFCRCHRPRKRAALVMWCGWFKPRLEIRHAAALTTGAKHWHRQKAVFYVFVSVPPVFIHWTVFYVFVSVPPAFTNWTSMSLGEGRSWYRPLLLPLLSGWAWG